MCPRAAAQTSSVFSLCFSLPRSVNVEIYIDDLGQNILFIFFETVPSRDWHRRVLAVRRYCFLYRKKMLNEYLNCIPGHFMCSLLFNTDDPLLYFHTLRIIGDPYLFSNEQSRILLDAFRDSAFVSNTHTYTYLYYVSIRSNAQLFRPIIELFNNKQMDMDNDINYSFTLISSQLLFKM